MQNTDWKQIAFLSPKLSRTKTRRMYLNPHIHIHIHTLTSFTKTSWKNSISIVSSPPSSIRFQKPLSCSYVICLYIYISVFFVAVTIYSWYNWTSSKSCINLRNSSKKKHQKLARVMKKEDNNNSFSKIKNICVPFKSFGRRCSRLTREHRARFYILRRCVTMLICWQDCEWTFKYT